MSNDPDFSAEVAFRLKAAFDRHYPEGVTDVFGVWSHSQSHVVVVYRRWDLNMIMGMDVEVYVDQGVQAEMGRIFEENLGEPLGALVEELVPDSHGVNWWRGGLRDWTC